VNGQRFSLTKLGCVCYTITENPMTLMRSNAMPPNTTRQRSHAARYILSFSLLILLSGCCSLRSHDPLNIAVIDIEALPAQPMETRFSITLSVQNPNDSAIDYDGIALQMDINARPLATGVSNQKGQVLRFGENLIKVPMTISAYTMKHQAIGGSLLKNGESVSYDLRGKLGNCSRGESFSTSGNLSWPQPN
jgi:LEA14-like dessication related protein